MNSTTLLLEPPLSFAVDAFCGSDTGDNDDNDDGSTESSNKVDEDDDEDDDFVAPSRYGKCSMCV